MHTMCYSWVFQLNGDPSYLNPVTIAAISLALCVEVVFLCAIGHFVHRLFSVCHSYSDIYIVKTLEQIKITLIVLVNHASVHRYLMCPISCTWDIESKMQFNIIFSFNGQMVTENSICALRIHLTSPQHKLFLL